MTPELWQKVKSVLSDAIEAPPEERSALVAQRCVDDDECRREVESLLAAHDGADSIPGARDAIAAATADIALEQDEAFRAVLENALAPSYEILRQLGRGGMGAVYLAREKTLERLVAIKVLRPDILISAESRERFRREARTVAQLAHPGIVQLHTFGELPGVWYFVMSYVHGESLEERLASRGRIPWGEAHRILLELADALDCAHRHSVVHRDIKPANVLIDEQSGRSVLADFGISKMPGLNDGLTETGMVVGTPDYMSPEQTMGMSDIDERSDIYSLGAVAYVMLSGRKPFAGQTPIELMYARLAHDPPDIHTIAPAVPEELAAIVMRCLSRDRAGRWPNALLLKEALGRVRGSTEDGLPEGIKDLPSFGPYALMWVVVWIAFAVLTQRSPAERALLMLVALLVPIGLILHVWNVGRNGIGVVQMLRVASWPPEWWGMWWPRRLRRPSDVWSRLPLPARLTRAALSVVVLLVPLTMLLRDKLSSDGSSAADGVLFGVEAGLVLVAAVITIAGFWWARRRGLAAVDSARFLFGATAASTGWNEAATARMLLPAGGGVRSPDESDPADICRAIKELLVVLGAEADEFRGAADELANSTLNLIRHDDEELAALDRNANETEVGRLSARLASIGDPGPGQNTEQRELRTLLQQQLDVIRRMRNSHQILRGRRKRHVAVLHGLWTALSAISSASDSPVASSRSDIVGRIAELASESRDGARTDSRGK